MTHLSEGPGHQALQDWSTVFMEEVNFIQNEETHDLRQRHIANTLSCHNIPLFWGGHQHLKRQKNKLTCGLQPHNDAEKQATSFPPFGWGPWLGHRLFLLLGVFL